MYDGWANRTCLVPREPFYTCRQDRHVRNARLDCVDSSIARAGVAQYKCGWEILAEPYSAGVGRYLCRALPRFQHAIVCEASKAPGMKQQIAVEIAFGIEIRDSAARRFVEVGPVRFCFREIAACLEVVYLKSRFFSAQSDVDVVWPVHQGRDSNLRRLRGRHDDR